MCQTGDPCGGTQCCKGAEALGNSHWPESRLGSACCAAHNTEPRHTWERSYLLESTEMGGFPRAPEWRGTTQYPVVLWQARPVGTHNWKRGEGGGPGLACPAPAPLLAPDSAASPSQRVWCTQPGQVPTAANLPSSRPGAHVLFLAGTTVGPQSLLPPWAWGEFQHTLKPWLNSASSLSKTIF